MSKKKPAVQPPCVAAQTTDQPPVDQPKTDQPKTDQPPVDQPKTEQSPVEQPKTEQAPTQEAPQIDPIEKRRKEDLIAAIEARRKAACGE